MKKFIIPAVVIILLILLFPIPKGTCKDGGTKEFQAILYKIVKWNRMYEDDLCYNSLRIYFGKRAHRSVEELWWEINPKDMPVDGPGGIDPYSEPFIDAEVVREDENSFLVEYYEGSGDDTFLTRAVIPRKEGDKVCDKVKTGDVIRFYYDGEILETYPMQIPNISKYIMLETFDEWGISLSYEGNSKNGKITISRSTEDTDIEGTFMTGRSFVIQALFNGRWVPFQEYMHYQGYDDYICPEFSFTMKGIGIPDDGSAAVDVDYVNSYGELIPGTYRLSKDISLYDGNIPDETKTYYLDFDVTE